MIDIKLIRENKDLVKENIKKKFQDEKLPLVDEVYNLDTEYRNARVKADTLRGNKNKMSSKIGELMRDKKIDEANKIKSEVSSMQSEIESLEAKEVELEEKINKIMMVIPNIIDESVPIGKDDKENVEIEQHLDLKFRTKNSEIISYFEYNFSDDVVSEIVLGPTTRVNKNQLTLFLSQYLPNIKIKNKIIDSKIPLTY